MKHLCKAYIWAIYYISQLEHLNLFFNIFSEFRFGDPAFTVASDLQ